MNPTRDLARCATFTVIALFAGHLHAFAGQRLDPQIAAAAGCDTAALSRAQAEFERLQTLRELSPDAVSADALRAASRDYVWQSETCYQALYANSPKIDDGGMQMGGAVGVLGAIAQPFATTNGNKWGAGSPYVIKGQDVPGPGIPGGTVTYSFMATGVSMIDEPADANVAITSLPGYQACFITDITSAFAAWSAVANIQFVQVPDNGVAFNGTGAAGDIRIGAHTFDGPFNVLAHAFYPPPNGNTAAGDLHFDRQESWSCTPGSSIDIGIVTLHEVGHSIGLNHEPIKLAVMNPTYNTAVSTLQPDDINGVSSIYGPNSSIPPTATTGTASAIGVSSATLNGSVNPNGTAASGFFQYGTTASYGSALGPFSLGSGSTAVPLAVTASGLTCGTLYHFRIVGSSSAGTTNGLDATFSTSACPQLTLIKTGTGTGTVTTNPAGVNCGSTCTASFPVGQVVTLTATPVAGSLLTAWSGDPDCSDGVVTMSAARNCTATFTVIPPNSKILTISKTGSGTVTGSPAGIDCGGICSAFFTTGQGVTLSATASPGSMFGGWSGDPDCGDGLVTMSADRGCTATFKLVPGGDVNGDGKGDLLWRHTQTGDVALWLMNGAAITQAPIVAFGLPLAWQIANVGDLDGDGKADFIWRNSQTGDVAVWLMNGAAIKQAPIVAAGLPLAWQIANVADLDGDGKADLIFRNSQTGDVAVVADERNRYHAGPHRVRRRSPGVADRRGGRSGRRRQGRFRLASLPDR